jgi:membrane protein DedA with SNARE-associated domain/rhodanese-related sulfurtransferase
MTDILQFLLKYGYVVAFVAAFVEQIGLPLPAATLLIGMGALSRSGNFVLPVVVAVAAIAALAADMIWYELGWLHGRSVLRLICRISLEPDYCVRRTEDTFERLGMWALLPAKFIPGFNAAAVPLAGMMKVPLFRFIAFDAAGVMLWSLTYTLLGYIFSHQIERVILYLSTFGTSLLILIGAALAVYIGFKVEERHRFLKTLRILRITPEELKAKMDAGEKIVIFDMRNSLESNIDPVRIPGAFHVLPDHIEFQPEDLPPDQEIVLYCTCPNEATSARVALQLRRRGLQRALPLEGGLDAWRERKFPVESLD